jgi:serine phosphatase RsbU (regulator of sigma subunit)
MSLSFGAALRRLAADADADLHQVLATAVEALGLSNPVVYLVDFAHQMLFPLPVPLHGAVPAEEQIDSSLAGRAFVTGRPVTAHRDGHYQVWVPLLEGTERTGVIALTADEINDELLDELELLGVFAGLSVAANARVSDLPHLRRSGRSMSLAATMQWELMPPLAAATPNAVVAGVLEPAYDIAGDAFDYAMNGSEIDFAIFDGMGHGIGSSLLTGLAVGAYRHARRQRGSVAAIHEQVEQAVADQYGGEAFVTGIIARLSLESGVVTWTRAGHPLPLLLRERKVVGELTCEPSLPFGLGQKQAAVAKRTLQAGDSLLLYTDGVVEAQTPTGEEFGLERLTDQLEREAASGQRAQEVLRRLVRSVLDHRSTELRDDATLLMAQWLSAPEQAKIPGEVPRQRVLPSLG